MQSYLSEDVRESKSFAGDIASARPEYDSVAQGTSRERQADPVWEVFLAHQDIPTGLRAKEAFECVEHQLGAGHKFHLNSWRFELMEAPALREEAIRKASHADILVLSLHGDHLLSQGFCHWIEQWLLRRPLRPCALVVSLDEGDRGSESAQKTLDSLQYMVEASGVHVFPHFGITLKEGGVCRGAELGWSLSPDEMRAWGLN